MTSEIDYKKISKGDKKELRSALTKVESFSAKDEELLWASFLKLKKRPTLLGIVGTPGAGKSSFLNQLISYNRSKKPTSQLGMLLIDPSNPDGGGALLGDRVRLKKFFLDDGVYIRSVSNKGDVSGLTPHLDKYIMILSHFPFDTVTIESVGGGQSTTYLRDYVDNLILLYDPNSGDGIQHLKSGVLDVADCIVVSKADLFNTKSISNSLYEWGSKHTQIFDVDLLNGEPDFIGKINLKKSKDSQSFQLGYLKRRLTKELHNVIDEFSNSYPSKTPLTEDSYRLYWEKFSTFFQEKSK
ncbi:MAG: hypothetical protein HOE90_17015 [Bacteriovoracaceae bacterium]|jgi:putative protein kinase ArgK-like GTPase of G3E family|nr:hypothetical protein [Bacteriovoracaceae bacterium]